MRSARNEQTATLLQNGDVLVAGGFGGSDAGSLGSAELFQARTDRWATAGSMHVPRFQHTATLLSDGMVLVTGGIRARPGASNAPSEFLASAELYRPNVNRWVTAASMMAARSGQTATLLPNGEVLVVGGSATSVVASAELYNPATGQWSSAAPMGTARAGHTATLLADGDVLVAGGANGTALATTEIYHPTTNTWSPGGELTRARVDATATRLANGKVLLAGGEDNRGDTVVLASAELYDPATNRWSPTGPMTTARTGHAATLLADGDVLATGGVGNGNGDSTYLASAERYSPATASWSSTASMTTPRNAHTATPLATGEVLVAGGNNNGGFLASAEIYGRR